MDQFPLISILRYNIIQHDIISETDKVAVTHEMMKDTLLWQQKNIGQIAQAFQYKKFQSPIDPDQYLTYKGVIELLIDQNFSKD